MFTVKICGLTCTEDALAAVAAGADAVGLNFCPASKRCVTLAKAVEIANVLPPHVTLAGVFVDAPIEVICQAYAALRFDLVQLHGDEPPEFFRELRDSELPHVPLMRALKCGPSLAPIASYLDRCGDLGCLPRLVLLDAAVPGARGGTGVTCDWTVAAMYRELPSAPPLVLAGGLTADNVAAAIAAARPLALDVASGVESSPGRKDPQRMLQFVAAAKAALASSRVPGSCEGVGSQFRGE